MISHPIEKSGVALGRRFNKRTWLLPVLTSLLFLPVAGCHRDEVKTYRVAKDQNQPQPQSAPAMSTDSPNPTLPPGHPDISSASAAPGLAASGSARPQLTWQTPEGWTEVPAGEMRVASFKIQGQNGKQADVSVIPLPGLPGSDEANVNRWRGQVGLSPASPDELKKSAESVEAGGQPAQLYDIAGQNPGSGDATRILGAIQHRPGAVWFFKMTGDADLAEQQKPAFVAFLKSVKFTTVQAQTELPPSHPPIGDTGMGAPTASAPISSEGKPNWQVPAGWQEVSGGQFLVAKFTLTGAGGATAAVNVSSSTGEGGGLVGNINRWRGQLGLTSLSDGDVNKLVTTIDVPGGKASLVDLSGTDARTGQPTRLVGVIVPHSGQTWFYKLMGDAKVVEAQKEVFTKFVQTVKY
ncbi:MAG: hypothetical protein ABSC89_14865 [Verrucomicrobiota bacterium]